MIDRPDPLTTRPATQSRTRLPVLDFAESPFLVIWETTRACDLACVHCRASAVQRRDPAELRTGEAMRLLDTIREFGRPLVVFTGGDPLKRPDTIELVAYGTERGLRMGLTPSGTPLMTRRVLQDLKEAGLARLAVSLDGSSAGRHDAFRRVHGSFDWTVRMLREARELGLSIQVNTTVTSHTVDDLDAIAALVGELGVTLWSVFSVVPTGRARPDMVPLPDEQERVFHRLYELSTQVAFDIKTTAAPQYRRVLLQRQKEARRQGAEIPGDEGGVGFSLAGGAGRAKGVNDGSGFVFISHTGEIHPSGFLPVRAGNVRRDDLVQVYREHPMFKALRDPNALRGKCGACEYRTVCGGSRARAWALTGDWLESDPSCAYQPPEWLRMIERGEAEDTDTYFARRIPGWGMDLFRRQPARPETPDPRPGLS